MTSNHATWPHRLQEKLEAAYSTNIEIVNAAVSGYVSSDNLKNLRHRVLPLNPDLVIYYEANNEIVSDTRQLALQRGLITGASRPKTVSTLSKYSLLFDLAHKNLTIATKGAAAVNGTMDSIPPDLPARFIGVLDEIRAELAAKGVPLLLSTFIVKYRPGQDRSTQTISACTTSFGNRNSGMP